MNTLDTIKAWLRSPAAALTATNAGCQATKAREVCRALADALLTPTEAGDGSSNDAMVTLPARVYEDIMRDWERLRRFEMHVTQAMQGRDMLGEIDSLKKSRERWAAIAVAAQIPEQRGKPPRKRQR